MYMYLIRVMFGDWSNFFDVSAIGQSEKEAVQRVRKDLVLGVVQGIGQALHSQTPVHLTVLSFKPELAHYATTLIHGDAEWLVAQFNGMMAEVDMERKEHFENIIEARRDELLAVYNLEATLLVSDRPNGNPRLILEDVLFGEFMDDLEAMNSAQVQWACGVIERFRTPNTTQVKTGSGNRKARSNKADKAERDRQLRLSMRGKQGQKPNRGFTG